MSRSTDKYHYSVQDYPDNRNVSDKASSLNCNSQRPNIKWHRSSQEKCNEERNKGKREEKRKTNYEESIKKSLDDESRRKKGENHSVRKLRLSSSLKDEDAQSNSKKDDLKQKKSRCESKKKEKAKSGRVRDEEESRKNKRKKKSWSSDSESENDDEYEAEKRRKRKKNKDREKQSRKREKRSIKHTRKDSDSDTESASDSESDDKKRRKPEKKRSCRRSTTHSISSSSSKSKEEDNRKRERRAKNENNKKDRHDRRHSREECETGRKKKKRVAVRDVSRSSSNSSSSCSSSESESESTTGYNSRRYNSKRRRKERVSSSSSSSSSSASSSDDSSSSSSDSDFSCYAGSRSTRIKRLEEKCRKFEEAVNKERSIISVGQINKNKNNHYYNQDRNCEEVSCLNFSVVGRTKDEVRSKIVSTKPTQNFTYWSDEETDYDDNENYDRTDCFDLTSVLNSTVVCQDKRNLRKRKLFDWLSEDNEFGKSVEKVQILAETSNKGSSCEIIDHDERSCVINSPKTSRGELRNDSAPFLVEGNNEVRMTDFELISCNKDVLGCEIYGSQHKPVELQSMPEAVSFAEPLKVSEDLNEFVECDNYSSDTVTSPEETNEQQIEDVNRESPGKQESHRTAEGILSIGDGSMTCLSPNADKEQVDSKIESINETNSYNNNECLAEDAVDSGETESTVSDVKFKGPFEIKVHPPDRKCLKAKEDVTEKHIFLEEMYENRNIDGVCTRGNVSRSGFLKLKRKVFHDRNVVNCRFKKISRAAFQSSIQLKCKTLAKKPCCKMKDRYPRLFDLKGIDKPCNNDKSKSIYTPWFQLMKDDRSLKARRYRDKKKRPRKKEWYGQPAHQKGIRFKAGEASFGFPQGYLLKFVCSKMSWYGTFDPG